MVTVASSTGVTGRHTSDPNSVPCDIADRKMYNSQMSICICVVGSAVDYPACHATGPGSIPSRYGVYFHTYSP